jgi:hypothetical protein
MQAPPDSFLSNASSRDSFRGFLPSKCAKFGAIPTKSPSQAAEKHRATFTAHPAPQYRLQKSRD